MKKRVWLTALTAGILMLGSIVPAQAEILSPRGPGQIGYQAVVLCESLTAYTEPDSDSAVVQTLNYGDNIIAMTLTGENGWVQCALSDDVDGEPVWVRSDYIVINPSWYQADDSTPVYAWDDTGANKVALLSAGTKLPILHEEGDWLVVSLRGASGWIKD